MAPAPKSQHFPSVKQQMPAADPTNEADYAGPWWRNYGDESKDFWGMDENSAESSSYW